MPKDKILAELKKSIGKTSINDKTLAAYADIIARSVDDESGIVDAIVPYVEVLREFQGNINSVAAQAAKTKEQEFSKTDFLKKEPFKTETLKAAAEEDAQTPAGGGTSSKEIPDWQRAIMELAGKVEALSSNVTTITAEKTQHTLSKKLVETLEAQAVPQWFYAPAIAGRSFEDDAQTQTFAENLAAGWAEAKQKQAELTLSQTTRPGGGNGVTGKEASQKECEQIAKRLIG